MAAPAADSGLGGLGGFQCIMMIAFIGIFYALLIRPQQQQQKQELSDLLAAPEKGQRLDLKAFQRCRRWRSRCLVVGGGLLLVVLVVSCLLLVLCSSCQLCHWRCLMVVLTVAFSIQTDVWIWQCSYLQ